MKFSRFSVLTCAFLLASCGSITNAEKSIGATTAVNETSNFDIMSTKAYIEESTNDSGSLNYIETTQNNLESMNTANINEKMTVKIDGIEVNVAWEDNESVQSIKELAKNGGLTINTHQYGGFEQVGEIGHNIVSDNVQMTTEPGDIVLYAGNNIVVFYGSNSWSYTKLGKIVDMSNEELKKLLNRSNVVLTINNQ